MFRFAKNTLGWTTPALRTPEQADRWSWLIVAALTNCDWPEASSKTATSLGTARDPAQLTPARVRRGFGDFVQSSHPGQSTEIDDAWTRTAEGDRKPPRTAIRQSKRQPEQASRV